MAKSKEKTTTVPPEPPAMAAAMMAFNPVATQAWRDVMTECSRFVMDRLQQDFETQKALLNCKSPAELLQLQTEFYQTALKQYSEETMRLFQMMSEATGQATEVTKTGMKRGYDDVPL